MEPARDIELPETGSLDEDGVHALTDLLGKVTATPQSCWFAFWDGYGWVQGQQAIVALRSPRESAASSLPAIPAAILDGPRVAVPDRPMLLHTGPIARATALCQTPLWQSPNLWWPTDHAWCVASEIDFRSTYIAGPQGLVDAVLQDNRLEALPARPSDRITD